MVRDISWVTTAFNLSPGQPVPDLETYMQSLEKKQLALEKMMGNLASTSDDGAKKFFGCMQEIDIYTQNLAQHIATMHI
jgi:hypothetical protein